MVESTGIDDSSTVVDSTSSNRTNHNPVGSDNRGRRRQQLRSTLPPIIRSVGTSAIMVLVAVGWTDLPMLQQLLGPVGMLSEFHHLVGHLLSDATRAVTHLQRLVSLFMGLLYYPVMR